MATPMPQPAEKHALRFNGEGRLLVQFFEDYKVLADKATLTVKESITQSVKYMTKEPRRLVEKLPEFKVDAATANWDNFVKRVKEDYPDADAPTEIPLTEFQAFVDKNTGRTFETDEDLVKFTREFRYNSADVLAEHELSEADVQRKYYGVLFSSFGQALTLEMRVKYPAKKPQSCTIAEILVGARAVIKDSQFGGFGLGTDASKAASPAPSSSQKVAAPVKQEDKLYALLTDLGSRLDRLEQRGPPANVSAANAPQSAPQIAQGARQPFQRTVSTCCHYCGREGCRIANCEHVHADINAGRVKRVDGRLVLPDGGTIRSPYGGTMRDGVDAYHKQAVPPAQTGMAAMLLEVSEGRHETFAMRVPEKPEFDDVDAEAAWLLVMAQQMQAGEAPEKPGERRYPLRARAQVQHPTAIHTNYDRPPHFDAKTDRLPPGGRVAGPNPLKEQEQPARALQAPAQRAQRPSATIEEIQDEEAPVRRVPVLPATATATSAPKNTAEPPLAADPRSLSSTAQQFRLRAPVESDGLVDVLNKRVLDSKVVISLEELLAIYPALRRHWKDQTSTKRVTVALAETQDRPDTVAYDTDIEEPASSYFFRELVMGDEVSRDLIAAPDALPLRYLDCRVSHGERSFLAEGVIDNGSQLVIISKRFWEALGNPLDFDRTVSLEAANNTRAGTLGLCADLKVNIGGLDFYLQAQVVEEAPFSLLLGRPFLALAAAKEETSYDGSSVITLNCRNTQRAVRIPTRARRVPRAAGAPPLDF